MNLCPACLALLLLLAHPANAEIYKWTDASGKVHYGDQPPASTKTKTLDLKSGQQGDSQAAPASDKPAKDDRISSGFYTGLKRSEADKIRQTCQRDGKNMSLAQIRDNYCGMEFAGCRALREYLQETESAAARHRGESASTQALSDTVLSQLKAKISAKGC